MAIAKNSSILKSSIFLIVDKTSTIIGVVQEQKTCHGYCDCLGYQNRYGYQDPKLSFYNQTKYFQI